ncbi:hypothetical protein [Legionella spiritensis]|uniref:hypothetical protein n=1 Tax=Legionella spiritensis TaxID=452 RepID=UPI000F70D77C|nr:hypothetical protein [Legionella spiritensis]VEG90852.1 Uncharacterised protein [Legionella spiritensis]
MSLLEDYTDFELYNILQCHKSGELKQCVGHDEAARLIAGIQHIYRKKRKKQKWLQALSIPLSQDFSTHPLILLWTIVGVISLGTMPLLIGTAIMVCMSIFIGSVFFYSNYQEIQKKEKKLNQRFQLDLLKNQAIDLLLERNGLHVATISRPPYKHKDKLAHIRDAISTSLLISTTLFGTYFLGFTVILTAFQTAGLIAATSAAGPIGLLAGLGVILAVSLYFGYKQYQIMKQNDQLKFEQKNLKKTVEEKVTLCRDLKKHRIQILSHEEIQSTKRLPVTSTRRSGKHHLLEITSNNHPNPHQFFNNPSTGIRTTRQSLPFILRY